MQINLTVSKTGERAIVFAAYAHRTKTLESEEVSLTGC